MKRLYFILWIGICYPLVPLLWRMIFEYQVTTGDLIGAGITFISAICAASIWLRNQYTLSRPFKLSFYEPVTPGHDVEDFYPKKALPLGRNQTVYLRVKLRRGR